MNTLLIFAVCLFKFHLCITHTSASRYSLCSYLQILFHQNPYRCCTLHYLFLLLCITWRVFLRCTNQEALLYTVFSMFLFSLPYKAHAPSINLSGVTAAPGDFTASERILRKSSLLSSSRFSFLMTRKGDLSRNISSITVKLTDEAPSPRKIFLILSAMYCLDYILFSRQPFFEHHQPMSFS